MPETFLRLTPEAAPAETGAPAPDLRFEGRTARFDVYLPHRSAP